MVKEGPFYLLFRKESHSTGTAAKGAEEMDDQARFTKVVAGLLNKGEARSSFEEQQPSRSWDNE